MGSYDWPPQPSGGSSLTAADSVQINGGVITLVGDSATPGDSKYYGTDAGGALGFYNLPGSVSSGDLTDAGTDGIVITGGTGAVLGSGTSIAQAAATSSQNGYLKSVDWSTFNAKQSALTFSDSLVNTSGTVTLVGDSATPGDSKYYGTDSSGDLGYFSFPASTLTASDSIVITAGNLTLVGDVATPTDSQYYGTNSSGTRGFYNLPSVAAAFQYLSAGNTSVYGGTNSTLMFSGADNTVIGVAAGEYLTIGTYNTFYGNHAGNEVTNSSGCTAVGAGSTVGSANDGGSTAVGADAFAEWGSTAIGYGASAAGTSGYSGTGSIAIGDTATASAANSVVIGNNLISAYAATASFGSATEQIAVTTAVSQVTFGSPGIDGFSLKDVWIGKGAVGDASPVAVTIQPSPVAAGSIANTAGASISLLGGNSTGTGAGGAVLFKTAAAGSSGSGANTYATVGQVTSTGAWTLGAASTTPQHVLNTATATGSGTSTLGASNSPGGSTPAGWIEITINGTTRYIPFF